MSRKVLIGVTLISLISVFSLALVGQEIEKVKAYRDIYFLDPKDTVKRKVKEDPKIEYKENEHNSGWYGQIAIGDASYNVSFVCADALPPSWEPEGHSIQNPLLRLDITSPQGKYRKVLVQIISEKYGPPSTVKEIDMSDLSGIPTWSHIWDVEATQTQKTIRIGLLSYEEGEYRAALFIKYVPPETAKEEKTIEDKEAEEQAENF